MTVVHIKLAPIIQLPSKGRELPVSLNFAHFNWMDAAVTESEFNDLVDETLEVLETALDQIDEELDYENAGGVLTLEFENGTTMVFSRQPPTKELWLASRAGGFHFIYDEARKDWRDTRSEAYFRPFVVAQIQEQAGIAFDWG